MMRLGLFLTVTSVVLLMTKAVPRRELTMPVEPAMIVGMEDPAIWQPMLPLVF